MFDSVEGFHEVDCADVQLYTPLSTTLLQHSVHHQKIICSVVGPKPTLVGRLDFVQGGSETCVKYSSEQFI